MSVYAYIWYTYCYNKFNVLSELEYVYEKIFKIKQIHPEVKLEWELALDTEPWFIYLRHNW